MRFGAHCVLYGAEIASDPEVVIGRLARAGAEGCEIGQRFFGTDNREKLLTVLKENQVELSGMHCGGLKLIDILRDRSKAEEALRTTAEFMAPMKYKNVIATGGVDMEQILGLPIGAGSPDWELHDPKLVMEMAITLNDMVKRIRKDYGVQVHYHNHSWEFADDGLIFHALMKYATELTFAFDTGWAAVSGFDPVELLQKNPGRFQYVHLRDYKKSQQGQEQVFSQVHREYVDLGTGDMDYGRLLSVLDQVLGAEDWAIVEYEVGNFDESSYTKALEYVRTLYETIGKGEEG